MTDTIEFADTTGCQSFKITGEFSSADMLKMQRWRDITIKMGILQSTTTQQLESLQAAHLLHYRVSEFVKFNWTCSQANNIFWKRSKLKKLSIHIRKTNFRECKHYVVFTDVKIPQNDLFTFEIYFGCVYVKYIGIFLPSDKCFIIQKNTLVQESQCWTYQRRKNQTVC